jgi:hypothetical protein
MAGLDAVEPPLSTLSPFFWRPAAKSFLNGGTAMWLKYRSASKTSVLDLRQLLLPSEYSSLDVD